MYKIVLVGDVVVGKFSFIMRLCKGKFVFNFSLILGICVFFLKWKNVEYKNIYIYLIYVFELIKVFLYEL